MIDSHIIVQAYEYASQKHRDHTRSGIGNIPYISHLASVATLLAMQGCKQDIVIAGILHDTPEDIGVPIEEIAAIFGKPIANIVAAVTEVKGMPWIEKKYAYIESIASYGYDAALVSAADWIANCESALLESHGRSVFPPWYSAYEEESMLPVYKERFLVIKKLLGSEHYFVSRLSELLASVISL